VIYLRSNFLLMIHPGREERIKNRIINEQK
jgi:hypothetical protein